MISSCAFCADHATLVAPHAATLAATLADADGDTDDHHTTESASRAASLADADASLAATDADADDHVADADAANVTDAADADAAAADHNSSSVASPSAYRSATSTAARLRSSVSRSHTTRPSWSGVLRTHQHANNRNSRPASAIHNTVR
jgi:hypothetical protein